MNITSVKKGFISCICAQTTGLHSTELQDLVRKVHPIIRIQSLCTLLSPLKVRVLFCRQPLEVSRGIITSVLASEVRFSQTAYINWFILTSNYFHFLQFTL